jgi:hypothetical protein
LVSTKPICVEFYPRTSPITIAGARTARWARQFHAARQGPSLGKHAERSPRNLCLAGYTTFTALLHDKFLRPTREGPCVEQQVVYRAGVAVAGGSGEPARSVSFKPRLGRMITHYFTSRYMVYTIWYYSIVPSSRVGVFFSPVSPVSPELPPATRRHIKCSGDDVMSNERRSLSEYLGHVTEEQAAELHQAPTRRWGRM